MTRRRGAILVVLLALSACETSTTTPDRNGLLSLRFVQTGELAAGALDEGRIYIEGPGGLQTFSVAPGTTRTFEGLAPGTYSVALEGVGGGLVETFGETTGVLVTAGRNTPVTIAMNSFESPSLSNLPTSIQSGQTLQIQFSAVQRAASYRIEWDTNPAFSAPAGMETTSTSVSLPLSSAGALHVRVRAKTRFGSNGRPSPSSSVTVNPPPTLALTPTTPSTSIGGTVQFSATVSGLLNTSVIWRTANPAVASVNSSGLATGVATGTAVITAIAVADTTVQQSATLTVTPPTLLLAPTTATISVGSTIQLDATVSGSTNTTVIWRSSAPAVAEVDDGGLVAAVSPGVAVIIALAAADTTERQSATITVIPAPQITLDVLPAAASITTDSTVQFLADVSGTENKSVVWRSANPAVATITTSGLATGVSPGATVITAIAAADTTVRDSAALTVTARQYTISTSVIPVEGGTTVGSGTYDEGTSITLTATPASNYVFVNWTENGVQVSTNSSYGFQAANDRNLVANFELLQITITSTSPLPNAVLGVPYTHQLTGVCLSDPCTDPISWSLLSGSWPAGLTMGSDGRISGTPTEVGTFSATVQASSPGWVSDTTIFLFQVDSDTYTLTILGGGSGWGEVTAPGINCVISEGITTPPICSNTYSSGATVTLTAIPGYNDGSGSDVFTGWSGACTGNDTTCIVTMDGNRSVTARFDPEPPSAITDSATFVTATQAILNGDVRNDGYPFVVWFEYGQDPALVSYISTPSRTVDPDSCGSGCSHSELVTGLSSGTTYYFRIVARNAGGTTRGSPESFTTK